MESAIIVAEVLYEGSSVAEALRAIEAREGGRLELVDRLGRASGVSRVVALRIVDDDAVYGSMGALDLVRSLSGYSVHRATLIGRIVRRNRVGEGTATTSIDSECVRELHSVLATCRGLSTRAREIAHEVVTDFVRSLVSLDSDSLMGDENVVIIADDPVITVVYSPRSGGRVEVEKKECSGRLFDPSKPHIYVSPRLRKVFSGSLSRMIEKRHTYLHYTAGILVARAVLGIMDATKGFVNALGEVGAVASREIEGVEGERVLVGLSPSTKSLVIGKRVRDIYAVVIGRERTMYLVSVPSVLASKIGARTARELSRELETFTSLNPSMAPRSLWDVLYAVTDEVPKLREFLDTFITKLVEGLRYSEPVLSLAALVQ